ncbi:MAG: PhnA domain-containing protein [Flavobacteriia bacterium]|nr:PhnA domain-containing protein [Flavobacteriia bacterium]
MTIDKDLLKRAQHACECCGNTENIAVYELPASPTSGLESQLLLCQKCLLDIDAEQRDANHWRCLNDSMWSQVPAMQVFAWRMLHRLKSHGWPQDLLDMMYLEEDHLAWAAAAGDGEEPADALVHRDVNGVVLAAGDSVVLIKDLKVKGSSMVAKQGTAVRRISLDHENAQYIEGKVDGQTIVIITEYVKKL